MTVSISMAMRWLILASTLCLAGPVSAQRSDRVSSSFAIIGQSTVDGSVRVAGRNKAMLELQVRPVIAVTLNEAIPDTLSVRFGAKPDASFDQNLQLYGWPERPGLYCDVLRPRGLGISSACLRDIDQDGKFDEGLRLDFNSGSADMLVNSHTGKIIGARFNATPIPLPQPIAYTPRKVSPSIPGKLNVRWELGSKKIYGSPAVIIYISTPDNYTGTEGLSEKFVVFDQEKPPLDIELYGIKIKILGFNEKGAIEYQILNISDGSNVPLFFRGHRIVIIGY